MTDVLVQQVWDRMNESERHGVSMGLFPSWVLDYNLSHEQTVALMKMKEGE